MKDGGRSLGLLIISSEYQSIARNRGNQPKFEVHSLRPCCRVGPDGQQRIDLVAVIVQRRAGYLDPEVQKTVDEAKAPWAFSEAEAKDLGRKLVPQRPDFWFRGGSTLVIDPESGDIRFCVRKSILNESRLQRQRDFEQTGALPGLAATYFDTRGRNPFALLHTDDGD